MTQSEGINKQGEAMKSGGSETNNIVDDFKARVSAASATVCKDYLA